MQQRTEREALLLRISSRRLSCRKIPPGSLAVDVALDRSGFQRRNYGEADQWASAGQTASETTEAMS